MKIYCTKSGKFRKSRTIYNLQGENEEIDLKEALLLSKIYEYLPTLEIVQSPMDILIFTSLNRMKEQKDNEN